MRTIILISVIGVAAAGVVASQGTGRTSDAAGIVHTSFYSFDQLPVTGATAVPGSGGTLSYDPGAFGGKAGWRNTAQYPDGSTFNSFYLYSPAYNTLHMGFENYGYLEVDGARRVSGNSLRYVVTGGRNSTTCPAGPGPTCLASGLPVLNKKQYLDYLAAGQNPVRGDMAVGNPYLYFANSSSLQNAPVGFLEAKGANRLSVYIWAQDSLNVGTGGYDVQPRPTFSFGSFNAVPASLVYPGSTNDTPVGGHWYHEYPINGGGWIRFYLDAHPYTNNTFDEATKYPYPSSSLRSLAGSYFDTLTRLYITTRAYNGMAVPPFSVWIDEMEFLTDNEPQNDETISSVAVMYNASKAAFEVGFEDKYKNCSIAYATYELRYSFRPITNATWVNATPAVIQANGFNKNENAKGIFSKNSKYYSHVWASFTLQASDQARLGSGTTLYFALKDVSQSGGDGLDPVGPRMGRDYRNAPALFDYPGDKVSLSLIKRFDYVISESRLRPPGNVTVVR